MEKRGFQSSAQDEGQFDRHGDWTNTDNTLPEVSKSDLPKYWKGIFNKDEADRLTPKEHARISSEQFTQETWNAIYAWNKRDVRDRDPEIELNEPELSSPA